MGEAIEKASGKNANLRKLSMRQGDVNVTYADIYKAREGIDYYAKYDYDTGIRKFTE